MKNVVPPRQVPNNHHLQEKKPNLPQLHSSWPYTRAINITQVSRLHSKQPPRLGPTYTKHLQQSQPYHQLPTTKPQYLLYFHQRTSLQGFSLPHSGVCKFCMGPPREGRHAPSRRRAARYVKNKYHNRSSVTDMLADLQWKPLKERRTEARLKMLYKVINNKIALNHS